MLFLSPQQCLCIPTSLMLSRGNLGDLDFGPIAAHALEPQSPRWQRKIPPLAMLTLSLQLASPRPWTTSEPRWLLGLLPHGSSDVHPLPGPVHALPPSSVGGLPLTPQMLSAPFPPPTEEPATGTISSPSSGPGGSTSIPEDPSSLLSFHGL